MSASKSSTSITVLSYNIHYGKGIDGKYDLNRIANVILSVSPDIVGLQEISDSTMATELGNLTGMTAVFGQSLGRMDGYGDAILSAHPFDWVDNLSVPSASESRYEVMGVDVDLSKIFGPETSIRFINTHFDWLKTLGSHFARLGSVEVIEKGFFETNPYQPAILTGDLNEIPESAPLQALKKNGWVYENLGRPLPTIGAANPTRQIDYILPRPINRWHIFTVEVLDEQVASDHRPIVMTLELLPSP
jgi:endonuclease/exonuclease/phosphatase family metal-dependent hydrolase